MKFKSLVRPLAAFLAMAGVGALAQDTPGAAPYALLRGDGAVSAQALRAAVDPLFEGQAGETRALLVLRDGKMLVERYGDGFGPETRQLSWSLAKTFTALLVGIMVSDGRLVLDDPAPVAAWGQSGDPRGAITLRHLLQMRSGLAHNEDEGPREKTDALRLLVGSGAADQYGYAAAKPLAHAPGTVFNYSSGDSVILSGLMTDMLARGDDPQARRDAMAQFIEARLARPLGLTSLFPEYDARGTMLGGGIVHMSARDYAKLGEFMRLRGLVDGRRLISASWFDVMRQPSPTNGAYGAQLWLNRPGLQPGLFPGEARADVYGAVGYRGQFIIVSPAQKLVIVRLGITREPDLAALRHALARLVRAVPEGESPARREMARSAGIAEQAVSTDRLFGDRPAREAAR